MWPHEINMLIYYVKVFLIIAWGSKVAAWIRLSRLGGKRIEVRGIHLLWGFLNVCLLNQNRVNESVVASTAIRMPANMVFYSSTLSPDEICRFWNIVNQESVDPEMAVLRIKLQSLIQLRPIDCAYPQRSYPVNRKNGLLTNTGRP